MIKNDKWEIQIWSEGELWYGQSLSTGEYPKDKVIYRAASTSLSYGVATQFGRREILYQDCKS